jgi:DnaK suppressor protein
MREEKRAHYRETLLRLRGRLTEEFHKAVTRVAEGAEGLEETSPVSTQGDDRNSAELEPDLALEANREQMLEATDNALTRIEDGSYGFCEACGCEIPTARLDVLPFALRCVACEEEREEE